MSVGACALQVCFLVLLCPLQATCLHFSKAGVVLPALGGGLVCRAACFGVGGR